MDDTRQRRSAFQHALQRLWQGLGVRHGGPEALCWAPALQRRQMFAAGEHVGMRVVQGVREDGQGDYILFVFALHGGFC